MDLVADRAGMSIALMANPERRAIRVERANHGTADTGQFDGLKSALRPRSRTHLFLGSNLQLTTREGTGPNGPFGLPAIGGEGWILKKTGYFKND